VTAREGAGKDEDRGGVWTRMRGLVIALLSVLALAGAAAASAATDNSIALRSTSLGKVVVDTKARTLYLFEKDRGGKSACYGACAKAWPPALASGRATAGKGLKRSLLGTTQRRDGTRQLTYGGHPLYRFFMDRNRPGSVKGQNVDAFGAEWYVVGANGKKVER
jgi:predicted lipoprotein with Yx(FWY)xxD motif